jgi:hypothetical protein
MWRYDYRRGSGTVRVDLHQVQHFVANDLMPDIEHWLRAHPDPNEPIGAGRRIAKGVIEIETVRSRSRSFPHAEFIEAQVFVISKASQSRDAVIGGAVTEVHEDRGEFKIGVHAWLNAGVSAHDYLKHRMSPNRLDQNIQYGLYSLLIHELTHAAEAMFKKKPGYDPENLDRRDYYNDPKEVRAFMQQVADEVLHYVGLDTIRDYAGGNNRKLVDTGLKVSATWREIGPFLTPANKRRVLSAVYAAMDRQGRLF